MTLGLEVAAARGVTIAAASRLGPDFGVGGVGVGGQDGEGGGGGGGGGGASSSSSATATAGTGGGGEGEGRGDGAVVSGGNTPGAHSLHLVYASLALAALHVR